MKFTRKTTCLILFLLFPLLLNASEFTVKVIESGKDLPRNFYKDWKKGDIFVSDGKTMILIGGASRSLQTGLNYTSGNVLGSIVAFAPVEKNIKDSIAVGSPNLRIDNWREDISYDSVTPVFPEDDTSALRVLATADVNNDKFQVNIQTTYEMNPGSGRIAVVSSIKNTGSSDIEDMDYNIFFSSGSRYSFAPYNMFFHPERSFIVYPKPQHAQAWLDLNPPRPWGRKSPGTLISGKSHTVRYSLVTRAAVQDLMKALYNEKKTAYESATLKFENFLGKKMEVIVRDTASFTVFYRSFLASVPELSLPLPEGVYTVRTNFFPASDQKTLIVKKGQPNLCVLTAAEMGGVNVRITNSQGGYVPGKVTFIGLDPTKSPYFMPSDPMLSGRSWETFKNSCYPDEEGQKVDLPKGSYLVYASRGPEYETDRKVIEIIRGEYQDLNFIINKVVDTGNFVSMDPHMHTQFSDGTVTIADRVRSVIAEGVDVAVATDHNYIIDYSKEVQNHKMGDYLAVIAGDEVTRGGVIHYNSYPLIAVPNKAKNGAISSRSRTAGPLFKASQEQAPEGLIQVNHPRSGTLGYFNNTRLDQKTAAFANTNFDMNFDVLELVNGSSFHSPNANAINDWFHFLNKGYYFPLVGSSDSHSIDRSEPGYSRTYVMYSGWKQGNSRSELDINTLIKSVKKGRSFLSNGPFVQIQVNGRHLPGDTFTADLGRAAIWIKVQSASWIDVSQVKLIINGERRIVFNVNDHEDPIVKFDEVIGLTFKKDSYIAVEVVGDKSLFPVVQARARYGRWRASLPYALTNPVFIDVDGNGKFDPPWPGKIDLRTDVPLQKPIIARETYK